MEERPETTVTQPSQFLGNFDGYIERVQADLEALYGDDPGNFATVTDRAEASAPYVAARNWLVERWGDHYPCPVCQNVEWTVSGIVRTELPSEFRAFYVICGYCANAMKVIPDYADQDTPRLVDEQLEFPAPE